MRTKVTLALLFLNVVLFWAIFYLRSDTRVGPDPNLVIGPTANALQGLKIEVPGAVISLEQREDQWVLTRPIEWTANDFAVRAILSEVNGLRAETTFAVSELAASGQTLADYGLDKPSLTLTLQPSAAGAAPIPLAIGNATQGGNRLYILSPDGARIHVVSRTLAERLGMSLVDLRSDVLFNIPVFEAQTLTVESGPGQRTLLRRDGERWNIETLQARASRVDTELCLIALGALRLERFVEAADNLPGDAFSQPDLRVTVEGNRRRETLLLGRTWTSATKIDGATTYVARMEDDPARNGTVFLVSLPDALVSTLRHAQRELREKRLLEFEPSEVSSVLLRSLDGEVQVQRLEANATESRWQVIERRGNQPTPPVPAEPRRIEALLRDLGRLSAEDFTNDAPSAVERETYGLVRPVRALTLELAGSSRQPARSITVQVGSGSDHRTYAALADRSPVYRVSSEILQATPVVALEYRSRTVRELPAGARITHLRLERIDGSGVLLDADLKASPAPSGSEALASALRTVRAASLLEAPPSETGINVNGADTPWIYRLEAAVALEGGEPQALTLLFTERLGGTTWIATIPGQGPAFTLEQNLSDALFALTYGKRDPGPPLDQPKP
ncbi:DUF4340 domain-containing protein [Nibricoccus sp. IMCC34717]|uniref:DUF4340 domain-containing protein n=1 Tax=Nibricoccus sp. IMCC34717 TaxID=3034021 RepID=UPI00384AF626